MFAPCDEGKIQVKRVGFLGKCVEARYKEEKGDKPLCPKGTHGTGNKKFWVKWGQCKCEQDCS